MGRPRKVIEDGAEIETEIISESIAEDPNEKRAYVKNGVTRLRSPSEEKSLLSDGWERK